MQKLLENLSKKFFNFIKKIQINFTNKLIFKMDIILNSLKKFNYIYDSKDEIYSDDKFLYWKLERMMAIL